MSKSRGTFIQARTYLDAGLNPEYLRYYFATMLGPAPTDVDLDLKTFVDVVNSHVVGKFVNIASRCAKLLETHFANRLCADFWSAGSVSPKVRSEVEAFDEVAQLLDPVPGLYEAAAFNEAIVQIVRAADRANEYIAACAPWALAKDPARRGELHVVLSTGINLFRMLACALRPVLPGAAAWAARFLAIDADAFTFPRGLTPGANLADHVISRYEPLLTRIDPKHVETMIESSKESLGATAPGPAAKAPKPPAAPANPQAAAPGPSPVSIDDFARLDLRIGTVLACEFVDGSDKLLRFELDAGALGRRQIFSGIRASYQEPARLVGRKVVFIANLAPRKMRFGLSEGMILSAGDDSGLFLLDVDAGATPGMPVK
jgi:methionyl-tRNA synthetase